MTVETHPGAELPPPVTEVGVIGWLRHNLFFSPLSALATLVIGAIVVVAGFALAQWALFDARWGVITSNMRLFMVGLYPAEDIWRVWLTFFLLSILAGVTAGAWGSSAVRTLAVMLAAGQATAAILLLISDLGPVGALALVLNAAVVMLAIPLGRRWRARIPRRALFLAWLASFVVTIALLYGLGPLLPAPPRLNDDKWGLLLTILLSVVAIVISFPIGVALALGRRSRLPVVRLLSTAYIEIVRGVPLITVLFMTNLLLPLFLGGLEIDSVVRAMGGLTLFTAAYVAENVRGGLQAIPTGQVEAAQAIGLRGWQVNLFIVLPQALRMVIPANVGLFISLMKDTTLVVIIGIMELLGMGRAVLAQPEWLGASFEVYSFVAAVFFVLSYALSQASYRLEKELGVGER
jgi:general L-amino acid transport system permease protein